MKYYDWTDKKMSYKTLTSVSCWPPSHAYFN